MFGNRSRKTLLASAVLVGSALLMTACQGTDSGTDAAPAGNAAAVKGGSGVDNGNGERVPVDSPDQGEGNGEDAPGSGVDNGSGERVPVDSPDDQGTVGQVCGANDIDWSTRSETQAGGYELIIAKAKPGITCYLPADLPTVSFGSGGTMAGPAEQSAGPEIELTGDVTAYAGLNPKTTNDDHGTEWDSLIVSVGQDDPEPVSLPVEPLLVDQPVVTSWHTDPADAVPFS
ncbi:DUF4232 domain-containing protein [Streptomyces sp. NPDC048290]|uniref:DUF4232 domain-containing protein n=1 Tax=Streptomyces sp. NPDC048290 TaxID=3155811 RepID=UPI0034283937